MATLKTLLSYCFNMDGLTYEHQQNEILRNLDLETATIYLEAKTSQGTPPITPPNTITLKHQIDRDFEIRTS